MEDTPNANRTEETEKVQTYRQFVEARITYLLSKTSQYREQNTTTLDSIGDDVDPSNSCDNKRVSFHAFILEEYQQRGLKWLKSLYNKGHNGILADEIGVDKTIQVVHLIKSLVEPKEQSGPFLIIASCISLWKWVHGFEKWAPQIAKIVFDGLPSELETSREEIRLSHFNVVITTYQNIIKELSTLQPVNWLYVILDSGHHRISSKLKSTLIIQQYKTQFRLVLSDWPLSNNISELWTLLNFILPGIFNTVESFDEWFNSPFIAAESVMDISTTEFDDIERLLVIKGLQRTLGHFLLRRLRKDVVSALPLTFEVFIECPMSALQRKQTEWVRVRKAVGPFDVQEVSESRGYMNLMIMKLRKICNHPFTFHEVEELFMPNDNAFNDLTIRVAGKFALLDRVLPKFKRTGRRVLICFQMTQNMDLAEDFLIYRNFKYLRLDGAIRAEERVSVLEAFHNGDYEVFLCSARASGPFRLTNSTADVIIIFDIDWTTQQWTFQQNRFGQQPKTLIVLRLITSDSIEEYIWADAQPKLVLNNRYPQSGKFGAQPRTEQWREELLQCVLQKNEEEDFNSWLSDEELNKIISQSHDEFELFCQMDEDRAREEEIEYDGQVPARLLTELELPEIYLQDIQNDE